MAQRKGRRRRAAKPRDVVRRLVTIKEAASLTGLSERAIARRIERGTLPAEKERGKRMVPLVALYDQGLVDAPPALTITDLLDRLERQAEHIGRLEAAVERLRRPR